MLLDPDLLEYLRRLQASHPLPRDPNDLAAFIQRYEAASKLLAPPPVELSAGDFRLTLGASGSRQLDARLYAPAGVRSPLLMVFFHGGGWVAGSLASHDALCRQTCDDLKVMVASVHIPGAHEQGLLEGCDDALHALMILSEGRARLGADTERLLVAGDGSGAHLGLQAAWRLARRQPGSVDGVLAFTPLTKPDFNTPSYVRCAQALAFSREDAVRAWHGLLHGRWETWDERAVLMHGNAPLQRPPTVVLLAAEHDVAHDDAIALHDWLREAGARCEFFGAPGMPHDFARLQHTSTAARRLIVDGLQAFADILRLPSHKTPAPAGSPLAGGAAAA